MSMSSFRFSRFHNAFNEIRADLTVRSQSIGIRQRPTIECLFNCDLIRAFDCLRIALVWPMWSGRPSISDLDLGQVAIKLRMGLGFCHRQDRRGASATA